MDPVSTRSNVAGAPSPLRGVPMDPSQASLQSSLLRGPSRRGSTGSPEGDDLGLLSEPFVRVRDAFQLLDTARDGGGAVDPLANVADEEVVLLELEGGSIAITTAAALRMPPRGEGMEAGTNRGRGLGQRVAGRLFTLAFGEDALISEARARLREALLERFGDSVSEAAELGVSWLGTKMLLRTIEARLPVPPGLYRWNGGAISADQRAAVDDPRLIAAAEQGLLLFIHGTGSCTRGSFGDLITSAADTWEVLRRHFRGEIYGFEHHTFSESPIENAIALARQLPMGARLHMVSHSSGGLVADLLCLESFDDALIERFRYRPLQRGPLAAQLREAQAEQQEQLRELRSLLARKALQIERYVRVACPARGTLLLGERVDLFLSALLTLVSAVPPLAGQPVVAALKRVALEIVRRRAHPALVPGLAALMPDSPFGAFLAQAAPQRELAMAVIAGDCEGTHPLRRLAETLHDAMFFQRQANDLVVDTAAMQAGIASRARARTLLERASGVSHFHYFQRATTSRALGRWLSERQPQRLDAFRAPGDTLAERERQSTPGAERTLDPQSRAARGGGSNSPEAVVVLLPDLFATHLWRQGQRIWLDPADPATASLGGLADLETSAIEAETVFDLIYGDLCRELRRSHRVERFAYDWRQPLDVTAERLAALLRHLLSAPELGDQPVRLLAHGMGGLVARGMMARDPDLWQQLIQREGARLLMLGTPNQGTHHMVAALLGHAPFFRQLARIDAAMDPQAQLDALAALPGALQALPQPGFIGLESPADDSPADWYDTALWQRLKACNRDPWLGDGLGATPVAALLERGRWLWDQAGSQPPAILGERPERVILVNGHAPSTPCGVVVRDGALQVLGTSEGDGVTTWRSAGIGGIGQTYRMEVDHGGLTCHQAAFPALVELLQQGSTTLLSSMESGAKPPPALQDCQPIESTAMPWPSDEELLRGLVGGAPCPAASEPARGSLRVSCRAMDLRFVSCPVMVGHYEQDPLAGAEALIDRCVVAGELSSRERLGLYAGPVGTATIVLMNRSQEELHAGRCRGAVVIGLGPLGELSVPTLTEAVQVGTLRYLLQIVDRHGATAVEAANVRLASLLIGQNSSNAISIEDSVTALVQGVLKANDQFARAFPRLSVRVGELQIVEMFLDAAITATRALRSLGSKGREGAAKVEIDANLRLDTGWRHRLDAAQGAGYWPRLLVLGDKDPAKRDAKPLKGAKATLTDELRYAYLGERARAETIRHPRQVGLVEDLVAASIDKSAYNRDLSRSLFQLLVPTVFKDLARRLDQLVLVLDETTANFPWELLMADDQPMALQLAVVRQLQSPNYRLRVRQSPGRAACVIGNPLTTGFHKVFAGQAKGDGDALDALAGATEEAMAVTRILREHDYAVEDCIEEVNGADVVNKLYRQPYRVLHIAAHGVFEQLTRQGDRRSGVVLANGMLITSTEIEAMEVVPDLVFLNCCHLGTMTSSLPTAYNRLAASVARQLIEMGVRAVVACGWAVDDTAALVFAETFYRAMLANTRFGEAVFVARQAAHSAKSESNTWGAYQAYGDPAFQLDEPHDAANGTRTPSGEGGGRWDPVTPHELIDQLSQLQVRTEDTSQAARGAPQDLTAELDRLQATAPAPWLRDATVAMALAETNAAIGPERWEEACRLYLEAIRGHQAEDGLPLRAIEQLANLEARRGEATGDEALIQGALRRLQGLIDLLGEEPAGEGQPPEAASRPGAWLALLGSTQARLAGLRARAIVAEASASDAQLQAMHEALDHSIAAYGRAGGEPGHRIQRLALQAARHLPSPPEGDATGNARALLADMQAAYGRQPSFREGIWAAEALLALLLLDGRLAQPGPPGEQARLTLAEAYQGVLLTCPASPLERDAVLDRLDLLMAVLAARCRAGTAGGEDCERAARQLAELLAGLRPQAERPPSAEANGAGEDDDQIVKV
ncbi:MAG: CHAT domain-containing protein [Cyanobacteriota bacterium]|nr:CHAT domain-containing protein [Cyanobacteriota bacterium]